MSRPVANRHTRRAISISTVVVAFASSIVLSPLLFAIAAVADLITAPRRWRNTRLLAMVVLALAIEVATIIAAGALWLVFGAGRYVRTSRSFWLHHRLQRWYTAALMAAAERDLRPAHRRRRRIARVARQRDRDRPAHEHR